VNKQRLLESFMEMVKIDSPSREEAVFAAYLEKELTSLGFTVVIDDSASETGSNTGNLIAKLPRFPESPVTTGASSAGIILAAHMDCVEPCRRIEPVVENGFVKSQGDTILSADDKAGIATILEALRSVIEQGLPRPEITVLFTTGEELSLLGAKALCIDLLDKDAPCFVFDAGGPPATIVIGAPFHYTFNATFTGKAAHAGANPEAGTSAIQMAAAAIAALQLGRLDEHTTANIGIIEGGRETNIVPDTCVVVGECRSLFEERVKACCDDIAAALEAGAEQFSGSVEIEWELDYPGSLYEEDDSLVCKLKEIARSVSLASATAFSGGGADANVLQARGISSITLGIGMEDYHGLDEKIAVGDLEDNTRFIEAIISAFVD
jgi:tripeptide aminopeptidase